MSLFAQMDIQEIVGLITVILFFIGPAVWRIISAASAGEGEAPPARRPDQQPPNQQRPGQARPGQPRPAAAEAEDEISQFLRAAAGRRNQAKQQEARPQEAQRQISRRQRPSRQQPSQQPRRQKQAPRRQREIETPVEAMVVEERPVGGRVSEHVDQYLSSDEFGQRAHQLGQEVSQADQRVEEHRREVFDHQVGTLSNKEESMSAERPVAEEFPMTTAAGLAALLADTNSIRQAIVINEILTRPEDRWE